MVNFLLRKIFHGYLTEAVSLAEIKVIHAAYCDISSVLFEKVVFHNKTLPLRLLASYFLIT